MSLSFTPSSWAMASLISLVSPDIRAARMRKLWADSDRLLGVFKVLLKCGAWLGVSFT